MLSHTHLDIIRCGAAKPAHLKDVHMLSTTGKAAGTVQFTLLFRPQQGEGEAEFGNGEKGSGGRQ